MERQAAQAGFFYPNSPDACRDLLQRCITSKQVSLSKRIVAAIVPHAGWVYSGTTAGMVYSAIHENNIPKTFIIFGAVHVRGVNRACIWRKGYWQTPLGEIAIDNDLADKILQCAADIVEDNPHVHLNEHSIEVQIPFIQHLFPNAQIVPIMVPALVGIEHLGEKIAKIVDEGTIALASTDMTHYGNRFGFAPQGAGHQALEWVKQQNDQQMLQLILQLKAEEVVTEAMAHHNACGAGAISALLAYARVLGRTSGQLLDYTTSWDVHPERTIDSFVGYSGIVF